MIADMDEEACAGCVTVTSVRASQNLNMNNLKYFNRMFSVEAANVTKK